MKGSRNKDEAKSTCDFCLKMSCSCSVDWSKHFILTVCAGAYACILFFILKMTTLGIIKRWVAGKTCSKKGE